MRQALGLSLALLTLSCNPGPRATPPTVEARDVLAQIGARTITTKDLDDQVARMTAAGRALYATPNQKRRLLRNLVRFEILAAEARSRGYDADPEVQQMLKNQMIAVLFQKEVDDKITAAAVSEADVQRYYGEHASAFRQGEAVRVSEVLTRDRAQADKVAAKARSAKDRAAAFQELVTKFSDDEASRTRAGDLGFVDAATVGQPRALVEAALRLKDPGEISPVVESEKGFHVLMLAEHRPLSTRPLAEVAGDIRQLVVNERRNARREELTAGARDKLKVKVFEDRLSSATAAVR
jgi:peptidyl-prolyl cis-trans isomerase C